MLCQEDVARKTSPGNSGLSPEVADVNVGAQPDVVSEIPAFVVRVFVNHDIVAIPEPVVGVGEVKRGDAEVIAAKPETARIASLNAPAVSAAKAAVEAAMLPGMIEVEAHIVAPAFVSHPFPVVVDVRGLGVPFAVVVGAPWRIFMMIFTMFFPTLFLSMIGRRAVVGDVSAADVVVLVAVVMVPVVMVVVLCQDGQGEDEECCENSGEKFHGEPPRITLTSPRVLW
jgi:hypothetical protein